MIMLAVRWYLRYGLSYRDLEELLAERGIEVDHVTLFRWEQWLRPALIEAVRPCRHAVGGRWFVDETYVKVAGVWRYVYRAVDEQGQVIDSFVSPKRDLAVPRRFFAGAIAAYGAPEDVVKDLAQTLETVIEEQLPDAFHLTPNMATIGSSATMAASRRGCVRCADSRRTARPSASCPLPLPLRRSHAGRRDELGVQFRVRSFARRVGRCNRIRYPTSTCKRSPPVRVLPANAPTRWKVARVVNSAGSTRRG
jgi:transposase-like protein